MARLNETLPSAWSHGNPVDILGDAKSKLAAKAAGIVLDDHGVDALLAESEAAVDMPREFVVPGETRVSAALELARTIVRRAERRAVALRRAAPIPADQLVPYLNRLADLLWILARAAEQGESRSATPSRTA